MYRYFNVLHNKAPVEDDFRPWRHHHNYYYYYYVYTEDAYAFETADYVGLALQQPRSHVIEFNLP